MKTIERLLMCVFALFMLGSIVTPGRTLAQGYGEDQKLRPWRTSLYLTIDDEDKVAINVAAMRGDGERKGYRVIESIDLYFQRDRAYLDSTYGYIVEIRYAQDAGNDGMFCERVSEFDTLTYQGIPCKKIVTETYAVIDSLSWVTDSWFLTLPMPNSCVAMEVSINYLGDDGNPTPVYIYVKPSYKY